MHLSRVQAKRKEQYCQGTHKKTTIYQQELEIGAAKAAKTRNMYCGKKYSSQPEEGGNMIKA